MIFILYPFILFHQLLSKVSHYGYQGRFLDLFQITIEWFLMGLMGLGWKYLKSRLKPPVVIFVCNSIHKSSCQSVSDWPIVDQDLGNHLAGEHLLRLPPLFLAISFCKSSSLFPSPSQITDKTDLFTRNRNVMLLLYYCGSS